MSLFDSSDFVEKDSDSEDNEDSDYEVEATEELGSVEEELENTEEEIKAECDKHKPKKYDGEQFKALQTEEFNSLSDPEKINMVAKVIKESGGINVDNILELQQLVRLIMATRDIQGFEKFPRDETLKLLELMIYHSNSHINSLDI